MEKLTCLIREKTVYTFIAHWEPLKDFFIKQEKKWMHDLLLWWLDRTDYTIFFIEIFSQTHFPQTSDGFLTTAANSMQCFIYATTNFFFF